MSSHAMWKMIHLLHVHGPTITRTALKKAGITCDPDTIAPLVMNGVVDVDPPGAEWHNAKAFRLSKATIGVLQSCLLVDRREVWSDMYVDEPSVFVVMPFSESWSTKVFNKMIRPAIRSAGLKCIRGDQIVRTGELAGSILRELLATGFVIADVSLPNPNVYYEIGFAKALGKDPLLIKQKGTVLPADLAGSLYYDYDATDLDQARVNLADELKKLSKKNRVDQIRALAK